MKSSGSLKCFIGVLIVGLWVFSSVAEYIYWQVGSANTTPFAYAQFVQVSGDTKTTLSVVDSDGNEASVAFADGYVPSSESGSATLGTTTGGGVWSELVTHTSDDTFYLELFDESGQVAYSTAATYASIANFIHSSLDSMVSEAWTPQTVAPEPTSELLFLLGGALLALRRRRAERQRS